MGIIPDFIPFQVFMSFINACNIVSPLGFSVEENFTHLINGFSSIKKVEDPAFSPEPFRASLMDEERLEKSWSELNVHENYTKFEKMALVSVHKALKSSGMDLKSKSTGFILCTTKGNVDLLNENKHGFPSERIYLWKSAEMIAGFFHAHNQPVVISNACISGLLGIIAGHRMLRHGKYENVVVTGADVISPFIVSGFQSFKSLENGICKPFDVARAGLNLGEGAATVIMSLKGKGEKPFRVLGGASANDANHISGPSRTGEGLGRAIRQSLQQSGLVPEDIDVISAHGTATPYNDEMEAKALALAGVAHSPLNSIKGYLGHTLGAAGLIETILLLESMQNGILPATKGFGRLGVSVDINVSDKNMKGPYKTGLKTASGFGGCNAAAVFSKE